MRWPVQPQVQRVAVPQRSACAVPATRGHRHRQRANPNHVHVGALPRCAHQHPDAARAARRPWARAGSPPPRLGAVDRHHAAASLCSRAFLPGLRRAGVPEVDGWSRVSSVAAGVDALLRLRQLSERCRAPLPRCCLAARCLHTVDGVPAAQPPSHEGARSTEPRGEHGAEDVCACARRCRAGAACQSFIGSCTSGCTAATYASSKSCSATGTSLPFL